MSDAVRVSRLKCPPGAATHASCRPSDKSFDGRSSARSANHTTLINIIGPMNVEQACALALARPTNSVPRTALVVSEVRCTQREGPIALPPSTTPICSSALSIGCVTRREAHARMLGNGLCTRPVELDCRLESACETCSYFATGPEFVPVLLRQRDHARDHDQPERASLFNGLINRAQTCP